MKPKRKTYIRPLLIASVCMCVILMASVFIAQYSEIPSPHNLPSTRSETVLGKGWITDAVLSRDGQTLAISSSTGVRLYDADNLDDVQFYMPSDSAPVSSVAFSHDGHYIVEGRWDNRAYVWSLEDLSQPSATLRGHRGFINDVAFHASNQVIASASSDKTIRLWDMASGELLSTLEGHQHSVTSIDFSPDGQMLLSGSRDETVILWDVDSGEVRYVFDDIGTSIEEVLFARNGQHFVVETNHHIQYFLDIPTGQRVSSTLQPNETLNPILNEIDPIALGYYPPINTVAVSVDGRMIATGTGNIFTPDNHVLLWDSQSLELIGNFASADDSLGHVITLAYHPENPLLAIGDTMGQLFIWNYVTDTLLSTWQAHEGELLSMTFLDGDTLATGGDDGMIHVWDIETGINITSFESPNGAVRNINLGSASTISSDSALNDSLTSYAISEEEQSLNLLCSHGDTMGAVSLNSNNTLRATATFDNKIVLADVESGTILKTLAGHTNLVEDVTFSTDGRWLASASWDRSVKVWDVATGEVLYTFAGHTRPVTTVQFLPNHQGLVSGSSDGTVRIWDLE